jgi:hypothetical protein
MNNFFKILVALLLISSTTAFGQVLLENVVVVAQQNNTADRFNLELAVMDLLRKYEVNARSAISVVKEGQGPNSLANDSIQKRLSGDGFNMFMLISVRGYDKRFSPPSNRFTLNEELLGGHLYAYHREKISSVTFTISFFRNGHPVHSELIRVKKTKSPEKILKSLIKKMERRLKRSWGKQ